MDNNDKYSNDPIALSALLASRLCHDLVNPVGALSSGLEVLEDPAMADADMRDAALDLIKDSASKSVALLKFARLAYGAAGGFDSLIPLDEARDVLEAVYQTHKASLEWRVEAGSASKEQIKVLLTLVHAAGDFIPRGGVVSVEDNDDTFVVTVTGERLYLNDAFVTALNPAPEELTPKQSPIFIAALIAKGVGGDIKLEREEKKVTLTVHMPIASEAPAALTNG